MTLTFLLWNLTVIAHDLELVPMCGLTLIKQVYFALLVKIISESDDLAIKG